MKRSEFFQRDAVTITASAPGRLDVIGGIADYSGSMVLEMPIAEATRVTVASRPDRTIRVYSDNAAAIGSEPLVEYNADELGEAIRHPSYAAFRDSIPAGCEWSGYVVGCLLVLDRERGASLPGCDLYVQSDVPTAKGVSSSASLEVAAMCAIAEVIDVPLTRNDIPVLCQKVENEVVGAPCGLMDQLTCYHGKDGELLPILCQPDDVRDGVPIPNGICFAGIDSGVRHAVSGSSYGDVRTAAFMGYSLIGRQLGVDEEAIRRARESGDRAGLPFSGYLANVGRERFDLDFAGLLPVSMNGHEFLSSCGSTIDSVTEIDPGSDYGVLPSTRHPVYEYERVNRFIQLLEEFDSSPARETNINQKLSLGALMVEAHESYNACGLGNHVTDYIVSRVMDAGPDQGVYGAKITGGGSGGTVCVLCDNPGGIECVQDIAAEVAESRDTEPFVFLGSSDGARWRR
jgi:L-arabinokinase